MSGPALCMTRDDDPASADREPELRPPQPDSPTGRPSVVIVTGMSGAGRSTALRALEDLGYEAVDNPPLVLLAGLLHADAPAPLQPRRDYLKPVIVEAVAIDDRLILPQAKNARTVVAALRARRHRADFDKSKTEAQHCVRRFRILVKACRKADRITEIETGDGSRQHRIAAHVKTRRKGRRHQAHGRTMRRFRIKELNSPCAKISRKTRRHDTSSPNRKPSPIGARRRARTALAAGSSA